MVMEMDPLFHEVATLFPPMEAEEYASLVASIQRHGLREPIWRYQGKIIDGRHRYRACQQLGIEPTYREWDGRGSLVAFVVSLNFERRHLTSSQKAMVALEIEAQLAREARQQMARGGASHRGNQYTGPERMEGFQRFENLPTIHAAKQSAVVTGTNHQYVIDAKKIVRQAPELKDQVKSGTLTLPQAKTLAPLPENQRREALRLMTTGQVKTAKAAVLEIKKAEIEAQAQATPVKPHITLASWETWLPQQPSCDLLLTDPPYSTDMVDIEAFARSWLPLALSKVKATGRAYVFIGAYPQELLAYLKVRACLEMQQILVWTYRNTLGPSPMTGYKQNWQAILSFCGPEAPPLNCPLLIEQFSVQEINAPDGRLGNRYHTWQKPDELAERLIRHSTRPGDLILAESILFRHFIEANMRYIPSSY
ncbi:MAG TPA: DNA methyltransferase [Ktedonobacteraceae bacterium]|nr:DNA methyltransferase [Ktedonobacteraceae bacterium]